MLLIGKKDLNYDFKTTFEMYISTWTFKFSIKREAFASVSQQLFIQTDVHLTPHCFFLFVLRWCFRRQQRWVPRPSVPDGGASSGSGGWDHTAEVFLGRCSAKDPPPRSAPPITETAAHCRCVDPMDERLHELSTSIKIKRDRTMDTPCPPTHLLNIQAI